MPPALVLAASELWMGGVRFGISYLDMQCGEALHGSIWLGRLGIDTSDLSPYLTALV